jgi:four helix bundle protein
METGKYEQLRVRTKAFALRILKLARAMPRTEEGRVIGRQILRSGTSVGANYRAVCRARSRAEFVAKMGIVVEEADETGFWLELIIEGAILPKGKVDSLLTETNELIRIFAASFHTAKTRD